MIRLLRFDLLKINSHVSYMSYMSHMARKISQTTGINQRSKVLTKDAVIEQNDNNIGVNDVGVDVLKSIDFFGVHNMFTVKQLFEARAHFGHKIGTINKHMTPYIFGDRLGHLIFDLDQTAVLLRQALNFTAHMAYRGAIILFISRSPHTSLCVERAAKDCGEFAHCRKFKIGTFTDSTRFHGAITRLPDLVIFFGTLNNSFEQHVGVVECAKLLIPSVGIVDTNCDPTLITYPIPSNDDTYCTIDFYCQLFKKTILLAKAKRKEMLAKNLYIE